jgi:hypothetical protein
VREGDINFSGIVLPKYEAARSVNRRLCSDLADAASGLLGPFIMVLKQGNEELSVSLTDWLSIGRSGQRKSCPLSQGALGREDFFCDSVRHGVIARSNAFLCGSVNHSPDQLSFRKPLGERLE